MTQLVSEPLPRRFGRYDLLRLLGQGGMGRVYEAELHGPAGFRKRLAIKVLRPELAGASERAREALAREARLGGVLAHPNVVETWELGEVDGQLYIAMALVRGPSVHALLRAHGGLPPRAVLDVARQTAAGLAHIHDATLGGRPVGIVHRDLKPANLLVDENGVVRIADLGIATFVDVAGESRGTPSYMAPEQLTDRRGDRRSDLFSLGTIVWEATTGRRLFRRPSVADTLLAIADVERFLAEGITDEADRVVPGLGAVLTGCLRRDPADRFASAADLLDALAGVPDPGEGPRLVDLFEVDLPEPEPSDDRRLDPNVATSVLRPRAQTHLSGAEPLFGRDADLRALRRLVGERRLVTVKGAGGTGKTALVRRFGADEAGAWPGGVWFVDLANTVTWFGLLHAVSNALGLDVSGDADQTVVDHVGHDLRGRGPLLLVLDNFEQIVDLAPRSIERWLAAAPELRVLVTSRERLALRREHVYELGPLEPEAAVALLRARAGAPWAEADDAVLEDLARRLDGLPLALELAAARARLLAPDQLLDRLDDRFRLLAGRARGAPDRQATLRGAIAWSWRMLAPWEQAALGQLAAFRGGFFLEDAERVLDLSDWPDAPWTIDVIGSLWDKSLVVSRRVDGRPRFDLYESIRAFAIEQLDPAVAARARDRHAAFWSSVGPASVAEACAPPTWHPPPVELDNLMAAVDHATARRDPERAARLALAAGRLLERSGPAVILGEVAGRALGIQPDDGPWRLPLLLAAAQAAVRCGQDGAAAEHAARGLRLADGEPVGACRLHLVCAAVAMLRGRLDEAAPHVEEALARARERAVPQLEGVAVRYVAMLRRRQGRLAESEALLRESVAIARADGAPREIVAAIVSLGALLHAMSRSEEGLPLLEEALQIAVDEGLTGMQAICHNNLAAHLRALGRWRAAFEHAEASLRLDRASGNRTGEATSQRTLGAIHAREGRYLEAVPHLEASAALHRELEQAPAELGTLRVLAVLTVALGRLDRARAAVDRMLELAEAMRRPDLLRVARCEDAVLRCAAGEPAAAAAALEALLPGLKDAARCRILVPLGHAWRELGRADRAEEALTEALVIARRLAEPFDRAAAALELGGLRAEGGRGTELLLEAIEGRTEEAMRMRGLRELARAELVRGRVEAAAGYVTDGLALAEGRVLREAGGLHLLRVWLGDRDALEPAERLLAPFPVERCELAFARAWLLGEGESEAVARAEALGLPADHPRWAGLTRRARSGATSG